MALAAHAIARRLDPAQEYRPWFLIRGKGGIPATPEHASWDLGDMTGRYLEGLILARRMGVCEPELSEAEGRLQRYLLKLLGSDGLVHDPKSGALDHSFSQGSALYGLLAWFEDASDPAVRGTAERLITGMLKRLERRGDQLVDLTVKLPESSGSHLTGYAIWPAIRFYELTGHADALTLAEGLTRWSLADPVLGVDGGITKALSWEGHIHSWLDTLSGCVRAARHSESLDRAEVIARAKATYDWVRRSNATSFGWIATFPTHGSSETCARSSAIRLALELAACGYAEYFDDVERFVRNQVVEAQFRDLKPYAGGPRPPTPLLLGCFDSQSMPNCHLGTRGGEDVGTVEGCCLNGGMRALALAWGAIQTFDESGLTVNLALSRNGPAGEVIGYQPFEGRVDVIPSVPGMVRVRLPRWVKAERVWVLVDGKPMPHSSRREEALPSRSQISNLKSQIRTPRSSAVFGWLLVNGCVVLENVPAKARVSIRYPLRKLTEDMIAGGQKFRVRWRGDVVVGVSPSTGREPTYRNRLRRDRSSRRESAPPAPSPSADSRSPRKQSRLTSAPPGPLVPDTYALQDAARLASMSMLARMDLQLGGQPFFRIYPFATPPRAEHEKWDDGDMTGRYTEALILARRMTGIPLDPRENLLRSYLASLFDPSDGLCYTRGAEWIPRRACFFAQSTAMLGLLEWHRETGSPEARQLLDRQADGLMRVAVDRGDYAYFPKYEFDGKQFVNEPKDSDAPPWYGARSILPLVEYWQLSGRDDVRTFLEKLIRYVTQVSAFIKADGQVERGAGWWGHLHSTMDMATGVCEFGRLTGRREWVEWARRVYDWIGRTHTTRYGWVADVSGGHICESCAIASRLRLGLALYRAGVADPFGEIDRFIRNQLLESQFLDLSFLPPLDPTKPRTDRATYAGIDRMIRGTFQCWGTANDLIGHDDIEGCGAGGGVQGLAFAWNSQAEWRNTADGKELRVHLLFNRRIRAPAEPPLTTGAPVAAELWSYLPNEGRVVVIAHRPIARLALRLPDGADAARARLRRFNPAAGRLEGAVTIMEGGYTDVREISTHERVELTFPLREYETVETAQGMSYRVKWKGSSVLALEPRGAKVPLYVRRAELLQEPTPLSAPRYP
jgi:hypothetical protein